MARETGKATITLKNNMVNSLTGIQVVKDASNGDVRVDTITNSEQIKAYFMTALCAFIIYKISPSTKEFVAGLFDN